MSILLNTDRPPSGEFAIVDARMQIGWSDLDRILNRAISGLMAIPFGAERRVAVFAENSAEVAIAHLAGILAGVSMVPVSFHLTSTELEYVLRDSGARLVFTGPETRERAEVAAAAVGDCTVVCWRDQAGSTVADWDSWLEAQSDAAPPTSHKPLPFLHYTSGTTGLPKGVEAPPSMFAGGSTIAEHVENLRQKGSSVAALLSVRSDAPMDEDAAVKPNLIVNPMYHTGALNSVRSLLTGAPLVILGRFDAEKTLAAIDTHRVSGGVMVPTHFVRLLALPQEVKDRYDLSSLDLIIQTGAACPPDVKRRMIEWWGPVFLESYGATEIGSTNVIDSHEWLARPGSVGRATSQFDMVILDENGAELGPGQIGQICFHDKTGPGPVFHKDAEKTKSVFVRPGWFTLGEIGYQDEDGYLFITDRSSDMIVAGGVNIYPVEIENVLLAHPAVLDCAVIGVPHEDLGEQVMALVVLRSPEHQVDAETLAQFCRQTLAGYKIPRSFEFVADVGRNSMGKVNKRKLRAPYWPTERTIG